MNGHMAQREDAAEWILYGFFELFFVRREGQPEGVFLLQNSQAIEGDKWLNA